MELLQIVIRSTDQINVRKTTDLTDAFFKF